MFSVRIVVTLSVRIRERVMLKFTVSVGGCLHLSSSLVLELVFIFKFVNHRFRFMVEWEQCIDLWLELVKVLRLE